VKKSWYRLTLDVAYEGPILDRNFQPVERGSEEARMILQRVIKHDLDVALRKAPAGPVDWDLVSVLAQSLSKKRKR
jgi:hypothetical protein